MGLKTGEHASKDVYLVYRTGFTAADLAPADKIGDGERGLVLVVKGDTVTEAMVAEYERAEANAKARAKRGGRRTAAAAAASAPDPDGDDGDEGDEGDGDAPDGQ